MEGLYKKFRAAQTVGHAQKVRQIAFLIKAKAEDTGLENLSDAELQQKLDKEAKTRPDGVITGPLSGMVQVTLASIRELSPAEQELARREAMAITQTAATTSV